MKNWEKFENECLDYLRTNFGKYAQFEPFGKSDSTKPDILVTCNNESFFIEVKEGNAQCGQFVLLPNIETHKFEYSASNKSTLNTYSARITKHMDMQFDEYREAGTKGKDIIISDSQDVFSGWIIDYYKAKNVRYFITEGFTILSIDRFKEYFEITATYRIKRSGSNDVGKKRLTEVKEYLNNSDYTINDIRTRGNKLFIATNMNYNNHRFILGKYEYMISLRGNEYEIRRLSNTYNANVIFSIKKKAGVEGMSNAQFITCLH